MSVSRRSFLTRAAATAGVVASGGLGLLTPGAAGALPARGPGSSARAGYGPLLTTQPDMSLPRGFRYVRGGEAGTVMADGLTTPMAHDGMGVFPKRQELRLLRNHELADGPAFAPGSPVYDRAAGGGVTSIGFTPVPGRFTDSWAVLAGTAENCAGGTTPWGSWLTCEETTDGIGAGFERPHGYVFEVPSWARGLVEAEPLRAMGRFVHEAVAVDPVSGIVYLTEDNGEPTDGFYRFLPARPGHLAAGGRLQMLAVDGEPGYDTRTGQTVGAVLPCHWVDIDDPDPADAEAEPAAVHLQGLARGGARFLGGEGIDIVADGSVWFTGSESGEAELGQIWRYEPTGRDTGALTLLFESGDPDVLDQPDNIGASPRGGIVICEDGDGEDGEGGTNFLRGMTRDGVVFPLAECTVPLDLHALDPEDFPEPGVFGRSEFAGARFGPAGTWLFVHLQYPGATYAITGPWWRGGL